MEDATTFAFGRATPHAVLDSVGERVFEALGLDRALGADALCELDSAAVGGEEATGVYVTTQSLKHPLVFIVMLFDCHLSVNAHRGCLIPSRTCVDVGHRSR